MKDNPCDLYMSTQLFIKIFSIFAQVNITNPDPSR